MQFFKHKTTQYVPWNKGKLTGQKPPLQLKHVWATNAKLDALADLVATNTHLQTLSLATNLNDRTLIRGKRK